LCHDLIIETQSLLATLAAIDPSPESRRAFDFRAASRSHYTLPDST